MKPGEFNCISLFSSGNKEETAGNGLRLGDTPWIETAFKNLFVNIWGYVAVGSVLLLFLCYVRYRLDPHDNDLEELNKRRRAWLSHPAHESVRWDGGNAGIQNLWDKRDVKTRYT